MAFRPVVYWGSKKYEKDIVSYDQREENAKNKDFLTTDLVLCSSATWSILDIWQIEFKERCKLLVLPQKGEPNVSIQDFFTTQT